MVVSCVQTKKKECVYVCYGVERMDDIIAAAVYAS